MGAPRERSTNRSQPTKTLLGRVSPLFLSDHTYRCLVGPGNFGIRLGVCSVAADEGGGGTTTPDLLDQYVEAPSASVRARFHDAFGDELIDRSGQVVVDSCNQLRHPKSMAVCNANRSTQPE